MAFRMLVRVAADTLLPRSAASGSFAPAVALSRTQANLFGTDVSATSGVPEGALAKKVTIYAPARTAGQQGRGKTIEGASHPWSLSFPKGAKVRTVERVS